MYSGLNTPVAPLFKLEYSWFRPLRKQEFVGIVWFLSSSGQKLLVFNGKILLKPIKTAVFYCFLIFSQKSPSTVS